jgi:hypothetical protein
MSKCKSFCLNPSLDTKIEQKLLKFYDEDSLLHPDAASALSTLFWNTEFASVESDYRKARTDLLECLIFNYDTIFKSKKRDADEKSIKEGFPGSGKLSFVASLEETAPLPKPQIMITAGFTEATAVDLGLLTESTTVELGPLPYSAEVEQYDILAVDFGEMTKLEALYSLTIDNIQESTLLVDPVNIYSCLDDLSKISRPTRKNATLEDTTWTSFNTFDLPPLDLNFGKPVLTILDSQTSIVDHLAVD